MVAKGDVMPTWAATKSLLLSQSSSWHSWTKRRSSLHCSRYHPQTTAPCIYCPDAKSGNLECIGWSHQENDHHPRPRSVQTCPPDLKVSWQQELDSPSRYTTICICWSTGTWSRKNSQHEWHRHMVN